MTTHTPGPWTFKAADERFNRVFSVKHAFEVGWPDASIGVAVVPAVEANARLIAAAPDMLSACADVVAKVGLDLRFDDVADDDIVPVTLDGKSFKALWDAMNKATEGW